MESTLSIKQPGINITQRMHGIDALRGVAMIMGVLLHGTIAYKEHPLPTWPHDPLHSHWGFDYLYMFVHSFRMPMFFLIAGYFGRFLYYRIGAEQFIKHRAKRILIPFVASLVLILPLTILPFLIYNNGLTYNWDWSRMKPAIQNQLFSWNGMAHLWFLYYLLIYYAVVVVLFQLKRVGIVRKLANQFSSIADMFKPGSWLGLMLTVVPAFAILAMVPELFLHVDTGLFPSVAYVAFFGYFFLIGWLVNRKATDFFSWVTDKTWVLLGLGIGVSVIMFWLEFSGRYGTASQLEFVGIKLFAALQVVLIVYGCVGFFLKYCHAENATWKYISDASYWMYLIHLALVAGLQVLLLFYDVPGVVKFLMILVVTIFVSLTTYHLLVRYSRLGEILHGKREKKRIENRTKTGDLFFKKM